MIVGEFFDVHTTYFIKNSYRGTGLMRMEVPKFLGKGWLNSMVSDLPSLSCIKVCGLRNTAEHQKS